MGVSQYVHRHIANGSPAYSATGRGSATASTRWSVKSIHVSFFLATSSSSEVSGRCGFVYESAWVEVVWDLVPHPYSPYVSSLCMQSILSPNPTADKPLLALSTLANRLRVWPSRVMFLDSR